MRVKRSDYKANNNYIPVRVKVRWVHCNKDTVAQTQFGDLVIAKWKGENLDKSDLDLSPIPSGTCRRYQSSETIDYCTRGATLSLKYEGTIDGRDDSYCYAFDYMRVRKEWLPEDKKGDDVQTCSTTVSPAASHQLVFFLCSRFYFPILILLAYVLHYRLTLDAK